MKEKQKPLATDFDTGNDISGFFCIRLVAFINEFKADYLEEMAKAKAGNCSFKNRCHIYQRTLAIKNPKEAVQFQFNI